MSDSHFSKGKKPEHTTLVLEKQVSKDIPCAAKFLLLNPDKRMRAFSFAELHFLRHRTSRDLAQDYSNGKNQSLSNLYSLMKKSAEF